MAAGLREKGRIRGSGAYHYDRQAHSGNKTESHGEKSQNGKVFSNVTIYLVKNRSVFLLHIIKRNVYFKP